MEYRSGARSAKAICNVLRSVWFMPCARALSRSGSGSLLVCARITRCKLNFYFYRCKYSHSRSPVQLRWSENCFICLLQRRAYTKEESMRRSLNCICQTVPLHFPPAKTTKEMEINKNRYRDVTIKTIICDQLKIQRMKI